MCEQIKVEKSDLEFVGTLPQDDVAGKDAHASHKADDEPRVSDSEIPPKKRKTRRGKSKRKYPILHPYRKSNSSKSLMKKPEAPYNSNRFLIEDHGDLDCIDEELKKTDQASTSLTRTRDSSLSGDSDAEFYSTPDDEEVFMIKDFDDQYDSLQAERLQSMSKDELIQEFLILESKIEMLTKRLRTKLTANGQLSNNTDGKCDHDKEIQRLINENDTLKRENEALRTKVVVAAVTASSSDSADSETDSSDTCSTSSSSLSRPESPSINYLNTNGHIDNLQPI